MSKNKYIDMDILPIDEKDRLDMIKAIYPEFNSFKSKVKALEEHKTNEISEELNKRSGERKL